MKQRVRIDQLSMRLPPGFGDRAPAIARRVGELLGQAGLPPGSSRQHQRVGPVRVGTHDSDELVARAVSAAIIASFASDRLDGQPAKPATTRHGARHA